MTLIIRIVTERRARESAATDARQASRDAEWERIEANRRGLFRPVAEEFHVELVETAYTTDRMEFQHVGWRVWPVGWTREDAFWLVYEHPDVWYLTVVRQGPGIDYAVLSGPDGWEEEGVRDFLFRRYEVWRAAHPVEAAELEKKAARPAHLTIIAPLYRLSGRAPLHLAIWMPREVFDDLVALARHLEQNRPPMGKHISHRATKVAVDVSGVIAWVAGWERAQPEIEDIAEYGMLLTAEGAWQPRPPLDPMSEDLLNLVFVVQDDGMLTVKDDRDNWASIDLFHVGADLETARAR